METATGTAKKSFGPLKILCVAGMGLAALVFVFVGFYTAAPDSMEPALYAGERVMADRLLFRFSGLRRGDIIAYRLPGQRGVRIHRIVALPGESIELKDQSAVIDGNVVAGKWAAGKRYYNHGDYGVKGGAVKLPKDCYFVLGDYSSRSDDSRFNGFVAKASVVGRVFKRYYPFKRWGPVE